MPTAIVRIYTLEGFVIAADGRVSKSDGTVRSDSQQKLFSMESESKRLAYTCAGEIEIIQPDGEVLLNIVDETKIAMAELADERSRDVSEFSSVLCFRMLRAIRNAKKLREPIERHEPSTTHIFIDGYCKSNPGRAHIKLRHCGKYQERTVPGFSDMDLMDDCGYGSLLVMKALDNEDLRFENFQPAKAKSGLSMVEAKIIAINRIRAQVGDNLPARDVDPMVCRHIGGKILMATVTPGDGFKWVDGYAPSS